MHTPTQAPTLTPTSILAPNFTLALTFTPSLERTLTPTLILILTLTLALSLSLRLLSGGRPDFLTRLHTWEASFV